MNSSAHVPLQDSALKYLALAMTLFLSAPSSAQVQQNQSQPVADALRDLRPLRTALRRDLHPPELTADEQELVRAAFQGGNLEAGREGWYFEAAGPLIERFSNGEAGALSEGNFANARLPILAAAFLNETRTHARIAERQVLRTCNPLRQVQRNESMEMTAEAVEYFHFFAAERPYQVHRKDLMELAPFELAIALEWAQVAPRFARAPNTSSGSELYATCVSMHQEQRAKVVQTALRRACEAYGYESNCAATDLQSNVSRTLARDSSQWGEVRERWRTRILRMDPSEALHLQTTSLDLYEQNELQEARVELRSELRVLRRFPAQATTLLHHLLFITPADLNLNPGLSDAALDASRALILWCRNEIESCSNALRDPPYVSAMLEERGPLAQLNFFISKISMYVEEVDGGAPELQNASAVLEILYNRESESEQRAEQESAFEAPEPNEEANN